jgi:hypothetical protein
MSFAIDMKTFSTLRFVFALVSKNLIPYSSAKAWPFAVGTA